MLIESHFPCQSQCGEQDPAQFQCRQGRLPGGVLTKPAEPKGSEGAGQPGERLKLGAGFSLHGHFS